MLNILNLEINKIIQDRFLLFMYFIMPLFVGFFVYSTISKSIILDMSVGVVDLDNSSMSRSLIFDIDASSTIKVTKQYGSIKEAKDDISTKEIYALLVIPKDFESDIKRYITPSVAVYYNTQLVFIGKNIQAALTLVFKNKDVTLNFARNIVDSKNTTLALGKSIEFIPKIISLYNPNSNFSQFLLTAILPCLWQLFTILCMISLVAYDKKDIGFIEGRVYRLDSIYRHLGAKFLINTIIFFIWWLIMSYVFFALDYTDSGSFWILSINAIVTILAYNSIGLFIYALAGVHIRAISIAAFYAAPSLAFLGITYPLNSMDLFPTFWGSILPIMRYMQVYIEQVNYALEPLYSLRLVIGNLPFLLFGILGAMIYKKKNLL